MKSHRIACFGREPLRQGKEKTENLPERAFESFWRKRTADLRLITRQTERNQHWYRRMLDLSGINPVRVLEIGCGTALDSYWLAAVLPHAHVVGIDNSPAGLAVARSLGAHFDRQAHLVCGDIGRLPFPDKAFDLVFSSGVIEHFRDPIPAMRESRRVARKGALIVVHVPQRYCIYSLYSNIRQRMGNWPFGWERQYSVGQMRDLGKQAGLKTVAVMGTDLFGLEVLRYFNSERLCFSSDGQMSKPFGYQAVAAAIRTADRLLRSLIPAPFLARITMNIVGFFRRDD